MLHFLFCLKYFEIQCNQEIGQVLVPGDDLMLNDQHLFNKWISSLVSALSFLAMLQRVYPIPVYKYPGINMFK